MKTFEERYTAWIDGELEGNALVAFEQELVRRAAVEESHADKADALRLNAFLLDHLQAPTLTNADFFNHQLRERIAGERASDPRPVSLAERVTQTARSPLFNWSFWRLAIGGAACLFISGALYYGTIPQNFSSQGTGAVASVRSPAANPNAASSPSDVVGNGTEAAGGNTRSPGEPVQVVALSPEQQIRKDRETELLVEQQKRAVIEPGLDIQAKVPDQTVTTTATPLHYKDPNVNVLWVNGLDYLPDTSGLENAAGSPTPSPAASAAPSVTATP